MRRAVLTALAAGAAAGAAYWRARRTHILERVDLYFEDGSMVSLGPEAPDAERLLGLARDVLAAAR